MNHRILIADDEKEILSLLRLYLENAGFSVLEATDGEQALALIRSEKPDLAILDIMMPKMDGYTLIRRIRSAMNLPVIILSAKGETSDKVLGLGMGADDYIAKPFDALEVVARVEANLRRFYQLGSPVTGRTGHAGQNEPENESGSPLIRVHDLTLDTEKCILIKSGTAIELTSIEYKMLRLFMESPGRVFTKKQIYEAVWGEDYYADDNNIMVYISKIRDKTGEYEGGSYIRTIRGLGYKMIS